MFVLRKRTLIAVVCVLAVVCALTGGVAVYALNSEKGATIVVDAGHGGIDGGVTGVNTNVKESDLNLIISKMLADKLKSKGYNVVETRKTSESLAEHKKEDMQKRKEIIEKAAPDIIISVHMNKFKDSARRGAQVFFDDTSKWEKQALTLQGALNDHLNSKYAGRADFTPQKGDYFMTKCYPCPSLIVECGFLSNPDDEKLLTTPAYQSELTDIIILGIEAMEASLTGAC